MKHITAHHLFNTENLNPLLGSNLEAPPALEAFILANKLSLSDSSLSGQSKNNLSPAERKALKSLSECNDIVIKPADKGSSVVIMDTPFYKAEAPKLLNDTNFHSPVTSDLTDQFNREVQSIIDSLFHKQEISEKCFTYLSNPDPNPGAFYLLPKIHKGYPPPGRPIGPMQLGTFAT